jgi:hypothetical protein
MISREDMKQYPEVDWDVYQKQNNVPVKSNMDVSEENEGIPIGPQQSKKSSGKKVHTAFGEMPRLNLKEYFSKENAKEGVNEALGSLSGMNVIGGSRLLLNAGDIAKSGIDVAKKGYEYVNPKAITETLRGKFGEGTVSGNIENLGERIKFGKQSAKEEALTPKREFMEEAKGKHIENEYPETAYPKSMKVEQADKRLSDLKYEIRELNSTSKKRGLDPKEKDMLKSYEQELSNLQNTWKNFIETLPEKSRGKYNEFTKKYAINVAPYEESSFIVRKLASGDHKGILPESIDRLFSNPNPKEPVLKIIKDIGPSGWNNLVFNMLSKYKPGDVKGMATAIIEGSRKGSPIITEEMVKFANQALRRSRVSDVVKAGAGGAIGGTMFGPAGAVIGAGLPFAKEGASKIAKYLKR